MKKTVHIIYPFSKIIDTNPWSIGNNIIRALKKNFKIKTYLWTSIEKISPNIGDILIGHADISTAGLSLSGHIVGLA